MNWRCFFGFHPWMKWVDIKLTTQLLSDNKEYNSDGQKRYCQACNKKQMRPV